MMHITTTQPIDLNPNSKKNIEKRLKELTNKIHAQNNLIISTLKESQKQLSFWSSAYSSESDPIRKNLFLKEYESSLIQHQILERLHTEYKSI